MHNAAMCSESPGLDYARNLSGMAWTVTPDHLERLAIGAGILGTGGGGNPYLGKLIARRFLEEGKEITVVDLGDVPDDALVCTVGGMGSPTVSFERLLRANEALNAMRALERHLGRAITHVVPSEIGGSNSTIPMVVAAQAGIPVIDADGMGRAFPELQMKTFIMSGISPTPAAFANYHGHAMVVEGVDDGKTLERYARALAIQMGGRAGYAFPPMTGAQVRAAAIPGTLSLAIRVGEAVLTARSEHRTPINAICEASGGRPLFRGKVGDVQRATTAGFARGVVALEEFGDDAGRVVRIDFQNENLIARTDDGAILAVVPDLICIVDSDTGEPLTTEVIRYGMRATVIGIPAPAQLRTEVALRSVGPAAFGYADVPYEPMPGTYGG
jgi:uncharacterized protein